jgi:hypothetical protein
MNKKYFKFFPKKSTLGTFLAYINSVRIGRIMKTFLQSLIKLIQDIKKEIIFYRVRLRYQGMNK